MTEHSISYAELSELREQWERSLQYGVLVAELVPKAKEGMRVQIAIGLPWANTEVELAGEVIEAQGAHSVTELDPFTDDVLRRFIDAGLSEALQELSSSSSAEEAEPVQSKTESRAEESSRSTAAVVAHKLQEEPTDSGQKAVSQTPVAKAAEERQAEASFPSESFPEPTGDRDDLATVVSAPGPATIEAEVLLPTVTQHGDFSKISWREVLLHFYERRVTGVLAIEGFRETRWCYFIQGCPVHYVGDQPHAGEFLSDVLIADGTVTSDVWLEALRAHRVTGVLPGEYLVSKGQLDRASLNRGLATRAQRITRKLMGMNFGTFRFHPYPEVEGLFTSSPVPILELVFEEQRRAIKALSDDILIGKVTPYYGLYCRLVTSRMELLRELPMSPEETHLVFEVLPANWVLSELVALREMRETVLVRFLMVLKELGLMEFSRDEGTNKERNRLEREVYSVLKGMELRSDFAVFGKHWSSGVREIREGHEHLMERFSAAKIGDPVDEKVARLLSELKSRADESLSRIVDLVQRRKLRKKLVGADEIRLAAEILQDHAKKARSASNFSMVRACCERVVDLDPEGSEGREMLARARKWLSDSSVASAEFPEDQELDVLRQDLARLN